MRLIHMFLSILTAFVLVGGLTACSSQPSVTHTAAARLAGTHGAAHFDDGYLQVGSGSKVVDLYVDPLCPFCKMFEGLSGPMLFAEASARLATVRIHPVALLDRLSMGTGYSTRAAAILTAVGVKDPAHLTTVFTSLYENQPEENTPGLTDARLVSIAHEAGAGSVTIADITRYASWVHSETSKAVSGPLPSTDEIASLQQVPTVVVDRAVFTGNSNETSAFAEFYRTH